MSNKTYWFKLPQMIQEKVAEKVLTQTCLDSSALTEALADVTWFRLPEKYAAVVAAINAETPDAPYVITYSKWFQLEQEVSLLLDYIDGVTCP